MSDNLEDYLPDWFDRFRDNHDALRDDLLQRIERGEHGEATGIFPRLLATDISESPVPDALDSEIAPVGRIGALGRSSFQYSRRDWLCRTVQRFAASAGLAAAGAGLIFNSTSKPLYALDQVVDKLQSAQRFYVRGTRREGYPFEAYFERPHTFWITDQISVGCRFPHQVISEGHRASNGRIRYRHEEKFNVDAEGPNLPPQDRSFAQVDLPIWSRIELEMQISQLLLTESLYDRISSFAFQRQESSHGQRRDVFERSLGRHLDRIYVDPTSLSPVKIETIYRTPGGKEETSWGLDEIAIDPQLLPEHIQIRAVNKEQVLPLGSAATRFRRAIGHAVHSPFQVRLGSTYIFPWAVEDKANPVEVTARLVDFEDAAFACRQQHCGDSFDGTTSWRWTALKIPPSLGRPRIVFDYTAPDAKVARSVPATPVELSLAEFQTVLEQMATREQADHILSVVDQFWPSV